MNEFIKKNEGLIKLLGMSAVLLMVVFAASGLFGISNKIKEGRYIGAGVSSKNTIQVSGSGEVYTKPDLAQVNFTVVNEAKTVSAAMDQNTQKMNSVIESVKNKGIEEKDLKTTNFNIRPRYEWREASEMLRIDSSRGKRILVGYEITQTLQTKIREMDKTGAVIKSATDAGVNEVGNVSFSVENEKAAKEEARKQAIKEAKNKARKLASQLGVNLVKIVDYNEGYSSPVHYRASIEKTAMDQTGGSSPNIQTGENKIKVNANITYEIN